MINTELHDAIKKVITPVDIKILQVDIVRDKIIECV